MYEATYIFVLSNEQIERQQAKTRQSGFDLWDTLTKFYNEAYPTTAQVKENHN